MYDMKVIKIVNPTSNLVAGIKPNGFEYIWFNYKLVSEFKYDIVNAINNNILKVYDYQDSLLESNIGAVEISNLIQEIAREESLYMWNINIGKVIICKFRLSAANAGVTADTSPIVFTKLATVMQYLLIGMLKEAANELDKLPTDELLTPAVKQFYSMLMRTSDAS